MAADLILTNGSVHTMDRARSRREAVAVTAGRIAAVGSAAEVAAHGDASTEVVDLGGRLVLPGFTDAHLHAKLATCEVFEVDLSHCTSIEQCQAAVAALAAAHPERADIRGWGYNPTQLDETQMTAAALDAVVSDRPVMLFDDSQHMAWVNTRLLEMAGITRDTPDPDGGFIERYADGSPSGLLREMWLLLWKTLGTYSVDEHAAAVRHLLRDLAGPFGITGMHEAGVDSGDPLFAALADLEEAGELTARFSVSVSLDPDRPVREQVEAAVEQRARCRGPLARVTAVKLFVDGVIEGHTGYLKEPYRDRPGFRGEPIWAPERLVEASVAAAEASFQLHYHAIGDAAVSLALDAIAAARPQAAAADARDIITHLQVVAPQDIPRFATLGVTAAVQPYWHASYPSYVEGLYLPFLGRERATHQYPLRAFFDAGVLVASASDYPVSPPPDPLLAIQRGVLRRDLQSPEESTELWPEQAVTVARMVESFTINGARANFLEAETGSIEVGRSADLVVLAGDILALPAEEIDTAHPELTLFAGRPVYAAGAFAGLEAPTA